MTVAAQGFPNISQPFVDQDGKINQAWFQLLISLWTRTGAAQGAQTFSTGDLKASASNAPQDGWLLCDGQEVSRTQYQALFTAINTTWGAGDGVTTFNLPNLQGKTLLGFDTTFPIASTGGNATQSITVSNLPAHNHGITDPGHVHASVVAASNVATGNVAGGVTAGNTSSAMTGITTNNTGSGDPLSILPPYAAVSYLIKT